MRKVLYSLPFIPALLVLVSTIPAQRTDTLKPTVFAVRDAKVITEPGKVLRRRATIVIRDGVDRGGRPRRQNSRRRFLQLTARASPFTPGFIDALSNWGYDNALRRSEGGSCRVEDFASPNRWPRPKADNRKGMTPEFVVAKHLLQNDDEQGRQLAEAPAGFTAHLVAPDGGFLVGQKAPWSVSWSGGCGRVTPCLRLAGRATSGVPRWLRAAATTRVPSWALHRSHPARRCSTPAITSGCGRRL